MDTIDGKPRAEKGAERLLLDDDPHFAKQYFWALKNNDMESVARVLSGRLRAMDKRAKAANTRADFHERNARKMFELLSLAKMAFVNVKNGLADDGAGYWADCGYEPEMVDKMLELLADIGPRRSGLVDG